MDVFSFFWILYEIKFIFKNGANQMNAYNFNHFINLLKRNSIKFEQFLAVYVKVLYNIQLTWKKNCDIP